MTRRPRRNHTPAFKAKVALAAIKGEKTLGKLAQQFDINPNQITQWRGAASRRSSRGIRIRKSRRQPGAAGGSDGAACQDPRADAGERFFAGALVKAGLLSAKR